MQFYAGIQKVAALVCDKRVGLGVKAKLRYDTIRDAILTCARKLNLPHGTDN